MDWLLFCLVNCCLHFFVLWSFVQPNSDDVIKCQRVCVSYVDNLTKTRIIKINSQYFRLINSIYFGKLLFIFHEASFCWTLAFWYSVSKYKALCNDQHMMISPCLIHTKRSLLLSSPPSPLTYDSTIYVISFTKIRQSINWNVFLFTTFAQAEKKKKKTRSICIYQIAYLSHHLWISTEKSSMHDDGINDPKSKRLQESDGKKYRRRVGH